MLRASCVALLLATALPAAAQDRGGVPMQDRGQDRGGAPAREPTVTLRQIEANRGCPMSSTNVTVGVNKATGTGSSSQQKLATKGGSGTPDCRPLVSTQVVTGVNMGLGRGSSASQAIDAT